MKTNSITNFLYKSIVAIAIIVFSSTHLSARRYYNPEQTKKKAIEMIRANSESVSEIAGLEPITADSSLIENMNDDSELLSDAELDDEEAQVLDLMEQEDENYEDVDVDINNFEKQWLSYVSDGETSTFTENGIRKDQIMESILDWLGTPYRFGGTSRKSIDCSAFTQTIFKEAAEVKLPRTARWQYTLGEKIDNLDDLQFGDLIFFHTRSYARASHCGIYLGDNLFAHASSRHGVTVSSLKSGYYNKRFIGGRRLTDEDIIQLSTVKEQDEQPNTKFGG
ncbi:MAG: C40 family peptidase [Candidatus Kapaibacterium sp.]|nr:C40 family peptidase [Ignavibacteriota bacterium]MCB9220296.1 C40 family peptidase [Ignavibacteria bacterium]